MKKKYALSLFILYCLIMLILLFARDRRIAGMDHLRQMAVSYNLIPFHTLRHYCYLLTLDAHRTHAIVNLVGNVVMFLPLGALLPLVFPRLQKLWKTCLVTLLIMYLVETAQILTLTGFFDVDDLILNLLGAAIGYGCFRILQKKPDL